MCNKNKITARKEETHAEVTDLSLIHIYGGKNLYRSIHKAVGIPSLVNDILQGYLKGQTKINLDLHCLLYTSRCV